MFLYETGDNIELSRRFLALNQGNGLVERPGSTYYGEVPRNPTSYCSPCEAFTSVNDAITEAGREFPVGGFEKWGRKLRSLLRSVRSREPRLVVCDKNCHTIGAMKSPQTKPCLDAVLRTGRVCRAPACESTQERLSRSG